MATTSINYKKSVRLQESIALKTFIAGLTATAAMTVILLIMPLARMPEMNVGKLLGAVYGGEAVKASHALGWVTHFIIGIMFAIPYVLFLNKWLPVNNHFLRGTIYGIIVYVFSMIMYTTLSSMGVLDWGQKEYMGLMAFGLSIACMIYGTVLGAFFHRIGPDAMEEDKREP